MRQVMSKILNSDIPRFIDRGDELLTLIRICADDTPKQSLTKHEDE